MKYIKLAAVLIALAATASAQQGKQGARPKAALAARGAAKADAKASGVEMVDRIFERYIQAQGGVAAMTRVRTRVMRGTAIYSKSNIPGTLEIYAKAPDKSLSVLNVPGGAQFLEGFDGKNVWLQTPFTGAMSLEQSAVVVDRGSEFGRVRRASEMFDSVSYRGRATVEGREVHLVHVTKARQTPQLLYFGVDDGLLRRADVEMSPTVAEGVKASIIFDTYATVDGIKIPINFRQVYPDFTLTVNIYEVKHNVHIDDSLFVRPQGAKANKDN